MQLLSSYLYSVLCIHIYVTVKSCRAKRNILNLLGTVFYVLVILRFEWYFREENNYKINKDVFVAIKVKIILASQCLKETIKFNDI